MPGYRKITKREFDKLGGFSSGYNIRAFINKKWGYYTKVR